MTDPAFGGWGGLPPLCDEGTDWRDARAGVLDRFTRELYGPVPPPPDALEVTRAPCGSAERLTLTCHVGDRVAQFDALLWLPDGRDGPCPIVAGLDFLGPIGLPGIPFPTDPAAIVSAPRQLGGPRQRLSETMRGQTGYRWPIEAIHDAGFGLLLSCYGSWVPDDPDHWQTFGLAPLLQVETGAISLWAWAMLRLIDATGSLPDVGAVAVAGHSRLGKAALWAGANDPRAAAVFANASGCAGAAPAAHDVGETLVELTERFPHWLRDGATLPAGLDQHHLLGLIAPRPLVLTSARGDLWADPVGSYRVLRAASPAWQPQGWPEPDEMWAKGGVIGRGGLCHGLRDGGHDLTPEDWGVALPVLARTLGGGRAV